MHRRTHISADPYLDLTRYEHENSLWPASWVGPDGTDPERSVVFGFRRHFTLDAAGQIRIHLTADQRYELYIDGVRAGRGPERGDLKHWCYDTYDLSLEPGSHTLLVKVMWVAPAAPAPEAQQTHSPALLLQAEGDANALLSTGVGAWEYRELPGYAFRDHPRYATYFAMGAQLSIDGRLVDTEAERGEGTGWQPVRIVAKAALAALRWESAPYRILTPAVLPSMYERTAHLGRARHVGAVGGGDTSVLPVTASDHRPDEAAAWNHLLAGEGTITIPPHTRRRVIIDLDDYYCAFPAITCQGMGATLRVHSAESLYHVPSGDAPKSGHSKGNRDQIDDKCFYGIGYDIVASEASLTYQPLSFLAGRYVELLIQTDAAPLILNRLAFEETHFPFDFTGRFATDDSSHEQIIPIALRTLEMCSHETSMDCPYYERLNYVGDTRLQALIAYTWADEERLSRKCIDLFDDSRDSSGFTSARYPTRTVQTIPTFCLWWIGMVHDYARWRHDPSYVLQKMPGVRAVLEAWRTRLESRGLLRSPPGWNFVDWVPAWRGGIPEGGKDGFSGTINLQVIYTLRLAAELEAHVGEHRLADRNRELADRLETNVRAVFFDPGRGLFADDAEHRHFSEHAQCMAVLAGVAQGEFAENLVDQMLAATGLAESTIYFSHYLFEAFGQTGRIEALLRRLEMWKTLRAKGFRTTFESPEPTRSDCHAWGAHPLYHFQATIAGIRPADFGFRSVAIRPQLGSLQHIQGRLPHRNGPIDFRLRTDAAALSGVITLPAGLPGKLFFGGATQTLHEGENAISLVR